jgi:hypothetical protein
VEWVRAMGPLPSRVAGPAALLAAGAVAAGCGGGGSESSEATTQHARTRPVPAWTATLTAPTHSPRAREPWPIVIRVTRRGRPLAASVRYQFLLAGRPVASRSHYRFTGTLHDTITWPARAVGIPLTFRAVVRSALGVKNLDYPVRVRPAKER